MTGTSKATVLKLLVELGEFCSIYQDHRLRDLPCTRIEADEIWAFCGAKQKNATQPGYGDIWTFTAICSDTKLMVSWLVGARSTENATTFMQDVAARLTNRAQLTTDGHGMYAVSLNFMHYNFCRVHATLTKGDEIYPDGKVLEGKYG